MDEQGGVILSPGQQGPKPQSGGPYPQSGASYPQSGGPYPQGGAPYPQSGAPYTQSGAPYPQAQYPAVVQQPGVQYSTGPNGGQAIIIQQSPEPRLNLAGYIAFSCIVFWFCNCLLGFIAFGLLTLASFKTDRSSARQLVKASLGLNIAGLILGFVLIGVMAWLYATGYFTRSSYNNYGGYNPGSKDYDFYGKV